MTRTDKRFKIRFDYFDFQGIDDGIEMDLSGYNAWDYFYGRCPDTFDSLQEAQEWLDAHHKGSDCDGVTAIFSIEEA